MRFRRRTRLIAVCISIATMLFMQLAVAAYTCPGLNIGQTNEHVALSNDAGSSVMPGCDGMDMEQPNLCHAYAQVGNQSLDKPELPQVQPWMPNGLVLTWQFVETAIRRLNEKVDSRALTRITSPPLSIRNCCFRI